MSSQQGKTAFLGGARWVAGTGETRPITLQRALQTWWDPVYRGS